LAGLVRSRIESEGPGAVHTNQDFLDLGQPQQVRRILARLVKEGTIQRLLPGVYHAPRTHPRFGVLSPEIDVVVKALARRRAIRIQPAGAVAANLLGLSMQVPARHVYLTDGASRIVRVGQQTVEFRHVGPRQLLGCGRISGLVFQALEYLGREGIDDGVIRRLRAALPPEERREFLANARYATSWVAEVARRVTQEGEP
jgi:hypothetical protein